MNDDNIFADDWRECLREHYKYVLREDRNQRNWASVKQVLLRPNSGQPPIFGEDELRGLLIEATMRADDVSEALLPNVLEALAEFEQQPSAPVLAEPAAQGFMPHPLECQCPHCIQINLTPHDAEGQPLSADAVAEAEEEALHATRHNHEDAPRQMSMF
ncbi:MAG: hypothetical protein H7Y11_15430 [Armatimonadetes bacterium]|nr:hypothetical protein [Anaerolineae bacterium]